MTAVLATPDLLVDDLDVAAAAAPRPTLVPDLRRHAWYPTSPCSTHCRDSECPDTATALLVAVRMIRLANAVLSFLVVGTLVSMLPCPLRRRYLRRAARRVLIALGVRLEIDDHRPHIGETRGLIVANHISYLDILAIATVSPAQFVAKSDVAAMPVISTLARRLGVITIERESLRSLPATVDTAVDALHRDNSVAVFPEGTTWCGAERGRFRPAFFQAAIDAHVPVLPVRLDFHTRAGATTAEPSFIGDDTPAETLLRVLRMRGLTMRIRVHELQLPGSDRRALAARCEQLVAA